MSTDQQQCFFSFDVRFNGGRGAGYLLQKEAAALHVGSERPTPPYVAPNGAEGHRCVEARCQSSSHELHREAVFACSGPGGLFESEPLYRNSYRTREGVSG